MLNRVESGDSRAAGELLPLVYEQLRLLASAKMSGQPAGQTLQATALVHEAWLKLSSDPERSWRNSEHFFRAAAEAMRHILVDRARKRKSLKHGGQSQFTELVGSKIEIAAASDDSVIQISEALDALARFDPVSADLVKLRFFVGLSMPEAAAALGLPQRTGERMWTFARAWLRKAIHDSKV